MEYYSSDDKDLGGEYPLTGRVKTTEDASGNVTRNEYQIEPEGAWGYPHWVEKRITTRNDGTANEIETYSIVDALGRTLESQSERDVTTKTYRVEAERRETTETWFGGEKLSYSTTLSNADGSQKESRVWYANAGGERITKYAYDAAGRLVRTDYPDGSFTATRYYPEKESYPSPQPSPSRGEGASAIPLTKGESVGVFYKKSSLGIEGWQGGAEVQ
jgi:YD repeat-containing protein